MATRRFFSGVLTLVLAMLACSGGRGEPNVQETVDAAVQATQGALSGSEFGETPSMPFSSPDSATAAMETQINPAMDEQTPCGGSKWQIFAVSKYEEAIGGGLKKVFVQLAARNGSSRGGTLNISASDNDPYAPVATTEGGFSYPGKFESGGSGLFGTVSITRDLVPPGFIVTGGAQASSPQISEPTWWSFEVADTQKKLSITFPGFAVICYDENGEYLTELVTTPLTIDVDKDISQPLDTAAQLENIKSLEEGIDIRLGRLEFVEAIREAGGGTVEGLLTLRLKFTNASAGYTTSGHIFSYLLDEDGAVHQLESTYDSNGRFEAGPGQMVDIDLKYVISKTADKFALVIGNVVNSDTSETIPIFQAYEIP